MDTSKEQESFAPGDQLHIPYFKSVLLSGFKGQSHEIFCNRIFHQSVHSGSIRDVHGPFDFFFFFNKVIALLKRLPSPRTSLIGPE